MTTNEGSNSKLKKLERTLKDKEAHLKKLIETTSHELRSPLTTIKGFVEIIQSNENTIPKTERDECFYYINKNLTRMELLINDIQDLSRIDRGVMFLNKKIIDFCEFLEREMRGYKTLLGKQISVYPCDKSPIKINADEDRILQVMVNILENAIKHTSKEERKIVMKIQTKPKWLRIEINDNGAGIEPNNLEAIFESFVSFDTEYSVKGTGIGLYISKVIIEKHGGKLIAKSEGVSRGSTFIVELPRVRSGVTQVSLDKFVKLK